MFTCGQYCSLPAVYMCWNLGQPLWFWVWKSDHSMAGRTTCVWFFAWNFIFLPGLHMSHKEHRWQEVLMLCLSSQTLSVFHRNRRLQAVLPPAHWGECRKQLEKQIVADRLSLSPLALTHDWTFTWMDEAFPFFSCSWKTPRSRLFHEPKSMLSMLPWSEASWKVLLDIFDRTKQFVVILGNNQAFFLSLNSLTMSSSGSNVNKSDSHPQRNCSILSSQTWRNLIAELEHWVSKSINKQCQISILFHYDDVFNIKLIFWRTLFYKLQNHFSHYSKLKSGTRWSSL